MRQQCNAFICNAFEALPNAHPQQRLYPQLGLISRKSAPEGRFLAGFLRVRRQNNVRFYSKARQRLFPSQIVKAACSADLQPFTQWLIENGAEGIHGDQQRVEFYRYGQEGRGLQTTTDVREDEVIFSLPLDIVLEHKSTEQDFNSLLGENLDEFTAMAVKLLRKRMEAHASPLHPYIQVLPKAVPSLYGAFPEGMRGELQGFVSEAEWEEGRNRTDFEFSKIKDSSLMTGFTISDFRWSYSIVSSRAFAVAREAKNGSGHEEWKMCMPLVDMLDHGGPCMFPNSPEPVRQDNVRWDMQDCGGDTWRVQVIAMRDIIKGEALLLRYIAGFPSSHFLVHYGFVPPGDPHEEVNLFPHTYGAVNWILDKYNFASVGTLDREQRELLAADAHKAARACGLEDMMAANKAGAGTRDALRKSNPLAIKLKAGGQVDNRLKAAVETLMQHRKGSEWQRNTLLLRIGLDRSGELLTQADTSLDEDLQLLARHAAPADRGFYADCQTACSEKARTLQGSKNAGPFLRNYEVPDSDVYQEAELDTCRLQAIQLRASHKIELLNTLAMAASVLDAPPQPEGEQPKKRTKEKASRPFKGFGAKK